MHIINFFIILFTVYGLDLLVVVAALAIVIVLIRKGKTDLVKKIMYSLVVKAEAALGSGTGDLKYNMVYAALPTIIKLLWTQKEIYNYIIQAVKCLDNYLGQGKNLLTYNQEITIALLPPEEIPSNAELNTIP